MNAERTMSTIELNNLLDEAVAKAAKLERELEYQNNIVSACESIILKREAPTGGIVLLYEALNEAMAKDFFDTAHNSF